MTVRRQSEGVRDLPKSLKESLSGGDRRSIGLSDAVVKRVLKKPELVDDLFGLLLDVDRLVRMRAADALEKATRDHPEWLERYKPALLGRLAESKDKELRWHVAQMLPRLKLLSKEKEQAFQILVEYLQDPSSIVRTFSMQALADLSAPEAQLREDVRRLIEQLTCTGTPAMRSRGRKLLKQLR